MFYSGQYVQAYIYSEQDDNDVTYFLDYQLKKIMLSLDEFHNYVERKLKENNNIEERLKLKDFNLNNRQKQLLNYLLRVDNYTTAEMHRATYGISRLTAYKDLQGLEALGFLQSAKVGNQKRYNLT